MSNGDVKPFIRVSGARLQGVGGRQGRIPTACSIVFSDAEAKHGHDRRWARAISMILLLPCATRASIGGRLRSTRPLPYDPGKIHICRCRRPSSNSAETNEPPTPHARLADLARRPTHAVSPKAGMPAIETRENWPSSLVCSMPSTSIKLAPESAWRPGSESSIAPTLTTAVGCFWPHTGVR